MHLPIQFTTDNKVTEEPPQGGRGSLFCPEQVCAAEQGVVFGVLRGKNFTM